LKSTIMQVESVVSVAPPVPILHRRDVQGHGVGHEGRRLRSISANMWSLRLKNNGGTNLFLHDVEITPEGRPASKDKTPIDINRILITMAQRQNAQTFGNVKFGYDGKKLLWSVREPLFESTTFQVKYGDPDSSRDPETFLVTISPVGQADVSAIQEWIRQGGVGEPPIGTQALDILLRHTKNLTCISTNRSTFDPQTADPQPCFGGFSIWRGWYQGVKATQSGLVLNIDLAYSLFLNEQTGVDFVGAILGRREGGARNESLSSTDTSTCSREMKGLQFYTTHTAHKIKNRVSSLTQNADTISFEFDGRMVSVREYYRIKYNIQLQFPRLPVIQVKKSSGASYFPLELVMFKGDQRRTRLPTARQAQDFIKLAAVRPANRIRMLKDIKESLKYNVDPVTMNTLQIEQQAISIPGARLLPPPKIKYDPVELSPVDGTWNIKGAKLKAAPEPCKFYGVLVMGKTSDVPSNRVQSFFVEMGKIGSKSGYDLGRFDQQLLFYSNTEKDAISGMNRCHSAVMQRYKACHCVFVITLRGNTEPYREIKTFCDTSLGVVTQFIQRKNMMEAKGTICANIILKLNVKVNQMGKNHVCVPVARLQNNFEKRPFMILGADVTHPPPGATNTSISIAALVASTDRDMTRYVGKLHTQERSRQEVITSLGELLTPCLAAFHKAQKNQYPESIIMFRDGVGEGMQEDVLRIELDQIRKACASFKPNYAPKLTFVLVNKRHHTRFFAREKDEMDRNGNVHPGTVIDTTVCHPSFFEFYLVSSTALQGTSKGTLYRCLYDENNFTADELQHLCQRLSYNYARCTRSVSIATPAYYAHHLASRGRCYAKLDDEGSSDPSTRGGSSSSQMPNVHHQIRNQMFFC